MARAHDDGKRHDRQQQRTPHSADERLLPRIESREEHDRHDVAVDHDGRGANEPKDRLDARDPRGHEERSEEQRTGRKEVRRSRQVDRGFLGHELFEDRAAAMEKERER